MSETVDYKPWYDAVTDACCICFIDWDETDARKSLSKLIQWHVETALDPRVSSEAMALIKLGKDSNDVA